MLRHDKSSPEVHPASRMSNGEESGLLSPNSSSSSSGAAVSTSVAMATPKSTATVATVATGIENKAYDGSMDGPASIAVSQQQQQQAPPPPPAAHPAEPSSSSSSLYMHADSKFWLIPDCTRPEAEHLLSNKADGTFLIRRSAAGSAPFALSIAYRKVDKGVGHILIHRSERGFGFTEPYLLFPTLNDLVVYYADHSLEEHNQQLTTTLAYPLHGPQPIPSDANH